MTPRQALLWFSAFLIILGVIYGLVSYIFFESMSNSFIGGAITVIGIVLIAFVLNIRWSGHH
ncbi:MAG TPA: hypothetical protein VJB89_01220 [Candidatus Nanoarchaeia archaeon]|nr:hypothetical protein [Candidatus Nanoarchaeia archaeon]